jgi:hypothetical protein
MIYSSGMPILYIIGAISFFVMYWFDKYCCNQFNLNNIIVVRLYKAPPRYGSELSSMSRNFMQYAVLFHMGFGFYMFSNSSIFNQDESKGQTIGIPATNYIQIEQYLTISRVRQKHALIYLVCMGFIFLVFLLVELIHSRCRSLWR